MQWHMQEPGSYTSDIGGIVSDGKNWWFYPSRGEADNTKAGPWKTLQEAKEKAAAISNGEKP